MPFHAVTEMMRREYDSPSRQATVQAKLELLRPDSFMEEHSITEITNRLEKLVAKINLLTPQGPPSFRDDENKIKCLRRVVLQILWSQNQIAQLSTMIMDFIRFVMSLCESLQLHKESGRNDITPTLFSQQYGRDP